MTLPASVDPSRPRGAGPCSTRRHATTLATCDSEPVQTPGCIQAHGALLVLRRGDLHILQARENSLQYLGEAAAQLLGQPVARGVGAAGEARLHEMLARETERGGAGVQNHRRAGPHRDSDFFRLVKSAVARLQGADRGAPTACAASASA